MSESSTDSPLRVFKGSEAEGGMTPAEMLDQISRSADTAIEERDFEQFLTNLYGDGDERWKEVAKLRDVLMANLTDIHVFVVPSKSRSTTRKLYVVGIDSGGNVTGIRAGNLTET